MSWAELEWPELSPEFPEPRPGAAPERPQATVDIGARVVAAERRRAWAVKGCVLVGACFVGAGLWAEATGARVLGVALMAAGLLVAFALAAYVAWVFGPTWEQRQQHWAVLRWEGERRRWRDRERERYLMALGPRERERFRQTLTEADAAKARQIPPTG
jgi:hypothetical protein